MNIKRKILIIDDNPINTKYLSRMLSNKGFQTLTLNSGKDSLEYIEKEKIELVLLDHMMPDMSGIEVLKVLRENYKPVELPVIMVTAKSDAADIIEALMLGANDYLTKPVNIEIAVARINTHINIVDLSQDSIKKKELELLNSMITTYNHEINNPLTIALINLKKDFSKIDEKSILRSVEALERITDIVKKIDGLTIDKVQTTDYTQDAKMINLE